MSEANANSLASSTLASLIAAQAGTAFPSDDVIMLVVPLFEQVAWLHARGKVATINPNSIVVKENGTLGLGNVDGLEPCMDIGAVHRVQPHPASALNVIGTLRRTHLESGRIQETDLSVQADPAAPIERPVYLTGPASWEQALGHHDEITDVFMLGMVLASLACGLDFSDEDDVRTFVASRHNLFVLQQRLHPIVAAVIVEMTEINRHDRATNVGEIATRLRTWRDQPVGLDVERAMAGTSGAPSRRDAVLSHLRDRLFDISRRNRLLYFRPTAATVNLTIASVPLTLQIERIRPEQICTWAGPFAEELKAGKPVALQSWLRFDDQPYLSASLDQLISETRRDRAEYGFSNLRLVVGFLRWHNLKESPDERIVSPLLWLPVDLVKRKGVRDQYIIQCDGAEAEFNPVLRHHLSQLYDIHLPETVDLEKTTLADIHVDIQAQIHRSESAVELRLVEKPAVRLVRQKALQRMQQYQRRRPRASARHLATGWLPPYSYAMDDYRPLGRALFEHWVRPSELPQRFEAGAAPGTGTRRPHMVQAVEVEERRGYVLEESDGHRYAWDLDLTCVTLANFNYKKMSLVRDYAQLLGERATNPAFDRVFSIEPREVETTPPAPLAPEQQWNVVVADATQNAAVGLARSQRSFIIQGPPGTGKSQTITNLIADYAGQGKRVLFVCEKRAALDVVFHRLKQSGLDTLCCLIHDSQADKKAFIADLKTCYEQWMAQTHAFNAVQAKRDELVDTLGAYQALLEDFEAAMSAEPESLGTSVRALLRRIVDLPKPPEAGPAVRERLPALSVWDEHAAHFQRLHRSLRDRLGARSLASHPLARIAPTLVGDEHAFGRIEQLCDDLETQLDTLDPLLNASNGLISEQFTLGQARATAADADWLCAAGLAPHLATLETGTAAHDALQRLRVEFAVRAETLACAETATANWRDKLTPMDTESALAMTRKMESSIMRWLQPAWWRLRGELSRRYDFSQHVVHPGYGKVLETLTAEHVARAVLSATEAEYRKYFAVANLDVFLQDLAALEERMRAADAPAALISHLRSAADPVAAARREADALAPLERLSQYVESTLDLRAGASLGELAEFQRDLRESLDDLPDLLPLLRAVDAGDSACAAAMRQLDHEPAVLEALIADEALRRLERDNPTLTRIGGAALAQAARTVAQTNRELLSVNAQLVRETQHKGFADNVHISMLSATQLDAAGKGLKKQYATGRRELEHEFGKSMRHRSIRDLSDGDTGMVINDIKPIWLMSPLSVSDTLPLRTDLFDVVIFDEASQIPTEEAIPALSRAAQVIIVGDEMQLPPTSFFSTSSGDSDDEIIVEEEGERIAICLDSDSLLNQAARNLPATLLAWHYRSRHESLISFSNAAFYDGRLVTIPDRLIEAVDDEAERVRSDQEDAGIIGTDTLLARPISFHRLGDGVYVERRNVPEARYIALMVRELLRRESGLSIGVVAFSEAQQSAIEEALDALGADDADFASRLEREYVREDDDQFNGLFVKNLENVQGDERDIIILSICYAPGPDGKMLMNFGPINQRGGEKRLNVIFSRARHRMAVVTTIQADAITNVHNDGAAALRTFLQFAQYSATGQFERAQTVLGALNQGARSAFAREASDDSIRDSLAAALRERGHQVQVNVGRSQFRCDLAIVEEGGQGYALAILLDNPATVVGDTPERYVFRPTILRNFGWKVLDIPGKDWIAHPDEVIERIESMLRDGADRALDVELGPLVAARPKRAPREADAPRAPAAVPNTGANSATPEAVRSLRFEEGGSRKFWRAGVDGNRFTVTFGRIGTNGQSVVKEFESADRARREMDKLVAEKLRKGYVDESSES
ncbi:MAG: DUF4011 domain-containing protein [Burkholderiales bacterium]|nr:DUF4011 domain-containing protein [Burkholderiales bacterium]